MRLSLVIGVPCCLMAISSCQNTVNSVERDQPYAQANVVPDHRVITNDPLAANLKVVQVSETKVSGDLLKIQVLLHNQRSGLRTFNYKFEWYDESGMQVSNPSSGFRTISMEGRDTVAVSEVAPSPRVVDFRLKLLGDTRE